MDLHDPFPSVHQSKPDLFHMMPITRFSPALISSVRAVSGLYLFPALLLLLALPLIIASCSDPEPELLDAAVASLLDQDEYESALELLDEAGDETAGVDALRVRVHLAYANYLTHEADHLAMRARMATALRHYRRVTELDPANSQALTHIELIEGIYEQMGRDIPEGVAE